MTKLVGFSGSLRKGSFNASLLRAAVSLVPDGVTLTTGTISGIPLYNADEEEAAGIPPAVVALKETILAGDGLLLVTPEYNNSIPGVTKNAIDWLSRPPADSARIFRDRPVAILGASPGGFGTILSQSAWLPVLAMLGTRPWFGGRLMVSRAGSVFDANGQLIDEGIKTQLQKFLAGFADFVKAKPKA